MNVLEVKFSLKKVIGEKIKNQIQSWLVIIQSSVMEIQQHFIVKKVILEHYVLNVIFINKSGQRDMVDKEILIINHV